MHLINRTLTNLHSFEDEHYEERQRYIRMIAYCNQKMAEGSFDIPFINMEECISRLKEKIEGLQLGEKLKETTADNTIFKQAVSDLVTKKIKKFTLIFDQTENVWLAFSNRGGNIKIISSPINKDNLHSSEQKLLEKIGFSLNRKNQFVLSLKNTLNNTHERVTYILLRVVFDTYYFGRPTESFIVFP